MTIYDVFPKTIKTVDLVSLQDKKIKENFDKILKKKSLLKFLNLELKIMVMI